MAKKPAGDAEAEERRRLRSLAAEQRRLAGPGVAREGSAVEALPPSPPPLSSVTLHQTEALGFEVATRRTQVVASKLSY
jgi:hypothetical protein